MNGGQFGLLTLAGLGAGLTGSVAGLASLISYPALLAVGISPVTANVTNTVALVLNGIGSVSASGLELDGQGRRVVRLSLAALIGGAVGALLLLSTPSRAFEKLVPWLIAGAALAILVQRPTQEAAAQGGHGQGSSSRRDRWWLAPVAGLISVYGGYFGAAAGVLMLAALLLSTGESVPRANALKNLLLLVANATAAVIYVLTTSIAWSAGIPLAIGLLLGGRLGPTVARRVRQTLLRRIIALAGLALAARLALLAYG